MGRIIGYLFLIMAGFIVGGVVGWLIGITWYDLIEVPYAYRAMDVTARDSYLCATGNVLALLAVPGAILGAIFTFVASIYVEKRRASKGAANVLP